MKAIKKTRKLERLKKTFFLFGLVSALWLTHTALTFKAYEEDLIIPVGIGPDNSEEPEEDAIITVRKMKVPPIKQQEIAKQKSQDVSKTLIDFFIKEIESDDDILDEGTIADIEEVHSFGYDPDPDEITVWDVLDRKPIFPGCEALKTDEDREACFNEMMLKHVVKNFEVQPSWGVTENVLVHFVIGKDGKVRDVECSRGDNRNQKEAVRVIGELPDFVPARYNKRNVSTRFTLPIRIKN